MSVRNLSVSNRYIEEITGAFIFISTMSNVFLKNSIFTNNSLYEVFYIIVIIIIEVVMVEKKMIFASI